MPANVSDFDPDDAPDSDRQCPHCQAVLKLARVSAGPSPDYEAHTFVCMGCDFVFTARVEGEARGVTRLS